MKVIKVRCTYEIEVEVEDDYYSDDFPAEFDIEESHCPGTGIVGAAFDKLYEKHCENSTCWGCALQGENKIISITDKT
jgi:hypothetical protein